MKPHSDTSNPASTASLASRFATSTTLQAILGSLLLFQVRPAFSALSFARGVPSSVGPLQVSSSADSATLTGAFVAPGTLNLSLNILVNRIQYDLINGAGQLPLTSWTIFYSPSVASGMIGAYTPLGYVDPLGTPVPQGGSAYTTLFNAGFGVYNYNTGAPWSIDYEADHITFTAQTVGAPALPPGAGVGFLDPTPYLPSFAIAFSPDLTVGVVSASALFDTTSPTGTVLGPAIVPEPSTLALGLFGAAAMACRRFRRINS